MERFKKGVFINTRPQHEYGHVPLDYKITTITVHRQLMYEAHWEHGRVEAESNQVYAGWGYEALL